MASEETFRGRFIDRVAVVTGASSGHGRAIALRLAREGAAVVNVDLRREAQGFSDESPENTTDELIRLRGGRSTFIAGNVTSEHDMQRAADEAVQAFGRLDVWVNNAGIARGTASLLDESEESLSVLMDVNLKGTWLGAKAAARRMIDQPLAGRTRGHIVNIGSIAGTIGQPDCAGYSASKGAVHNLTRALAIELAPQQITVNAVAPGYFNTALNGEMWEDEGVLTHIRSLHPLPLGVPDDVAAAVAFLGSSDASFVTGAILPVDGGMSAK